jgi:F-type H+/Na+-transporting ATPase subunit alpha
VLKQPQYAPVATEQQVMIIYAVTNGLLDDVPTKRVREFEHEFHDYMRTRKPQIGEAIRTSGKLEKDTTAALVAAVKEFKDGFMDDSRRRQPAPPAPTEPPAVDSKPTTSESTPGNPLV